MWGEKCKQRIASQLHRIRHWTIQQDSYEVLDTRSKQRGLSMLPIRRWVTLLHGSTAIDYALLATWCRSLQDNFVVVALVPPYMNGWGSASSHYR